MDLEIVNKDLVKEKGMKTVQRIKKKYGIISDFQEFEEIIKELKEYLNQLDSATTSLVFNSFTGNNLKIDYNVYSAEIRKYIARKYINEDEEVLWNETKLLRSIDKALERLASFMGTVVPEEFFEEYEANYEPEFDIRNLDFWEHVISLNMAYE